MAQGVFDILHPGHIYYLEQSSELGDRLVVVVARDSNVEEKETVFDEEERKKMVQALQVVDRAVLGSENDFSDTVEEVNPDVIALGYDQDMDPGEVRSMAEKATGHEVRVRRIDGFRDYSSRKIRR